MAADAKRQAEKNDKGDLYMKKFASKLLNQQRAESIAHVLRFVCYFAMAFYVFCLILSVLGRQSFTLQANGKSYDDAILAEENHDTESHILTVSTTDSIRVAANQDGQIDPAIRIGLVLIYAISVVPWILALWLLGRVFTNVSDGLIFTEQNASYLLSYGLLQIFIAVLVPIIKQLIGAAANTLSQGQLSLSTGSAMLSDFFVGIAFLIAAYIIHYGISLQDEVDHTL